jgi:acyl-CoA reductase-like NAD-dependent aldehyde dehydrogenase
MPTEEFLPFIHNEWIETYNTMDVKDRFTQEVFAKVFLADGDFMDMAIESGQKGFQNSKKLSGFERYAMLHRIVNGIERRMDELTETIVRESGKPLQYAKNEVSRAMLTFSWAAEEARRLNGEYLPLDVVPQTKGYFGLTRRFPIGLIFGISPFNFPLNLVAHKIAPALACGNAIILKPSSYTPLTALKLGAIVKEAEVPPGIINILPSSGKNAENLVKDGRIKKLSFTGSAEVGWYLKSIAGKKHITLELGGNAAVIVEPDIDWEKHIPRLIIGSFAYAGQVCISVQRIYVHESIFKEFIDTFLDNMKKSAAFGDPRKENTVIGPMIDTEAAKRTEKWIKEAVEEGAKILVGGQRDKNLFEPTVLTQTSFDMKAVSEEIFAPVVSIESYKDFDEAINLVNNSHYGLQTGVFTNDFQKVLRAYDEIEAGGVIINDYPMFRIDPMPYGGIKDSGIGREGIRYAIEEMTELKLLAVRGIP